MSHNVEDDAPCQSCGVDNRTCFLEGGYCCITCQDAGGMTHLTSPSSPEDRCEYDGDRCVRCGGNWFDQNLRDETPRCRGRGLSPIHAKYQSDAAAADYYDPTPIPPASGDAR